MSSSRQRPTAAFTPNVARPMTRRGPRAVGDMIGAILDPVLQKKAGFTTALIAAWPDVAGERLADHTRPVKVAWPRSLPGEARPKAAVLTVACSSGAALHVQHEADALRQRVNAFLGYGAIGRIRIEQRHDGVLLRPKGGDKVAQPVNPYTDVVDERTHAIEDPGLRAALNRLGAAVRAEKNRKR